MLSQVKAKKPDQLKKELETPFFGDSPVIFDRFQSPDVQNSKKKMERGKFFQC